MRPSAYQQPTERHSMPARSRDLRADTVRVLSVVSSWEGEEALHGFWLRELTHPYFFLAEAGVAVDIASTRGGKPAVAPLSNPRNPQTREREDLISLGFLNDDGAAQKLQDTVALSDLEAGGYAAVHFVGGVGPVHDFVNNPDVKRITDEVWTSGGVVSAICHGTAALIDAKTGSGQALIAGQPVTGYSRAEDKQIETTLGKRVVPFYIEDSLRDTGGIYSDAGVHRAHIVTGRDGRLLTGQNQESSAIFGQQLVKLLLGDR